MVSQCPLALNLHETLHVFNIWMVCKDGGFVLFHLRLSTSQLLPLVLWFRKSRSQNFVLKNHNKLPRWPLEWSFQQTYGDSTLDHLVKGDPSLITLLQRSQRNSSVNKSMLTWACAVSCGADFICKTTAKQIIEFCIPQISSLHFFSLADAPLKLICLGALSLLKKIWANSF